MITITPPHGHHHTYPWSPSHLPMVTITSTYGHHHTYPCSPSHLPMVPITYPWSPSHLPMVPRTPSHLPMVIITPTHVHHHTYPWSPSHTDRSNHSPQIASLLCCYLSTEICGLYIQMPKFVLQGPVLSMLMESLSCWALFAVMSYGSLSTRVLCCGLQCDVIFVTSPPSPGLNCNFNIRIAADKRALGSTTISNNFK